MKIEISSKFATLTTLVTEGTYPRYYQEVSHPVPLEEGEFIVMSPGMKGNGYFAVSGPGKIFDGWVGEGSLYDPKLDRLVPVKYIGEILGVSGRHGFYSAARIRGTIIERGEPRAKWYNRPHRQNVMNALEHPPIPGELNASMGMLLAGATAMDHGVDLPAELWAAYASPKDEDKEAQQAAYKAAKTTALASYKETALKAVTQLMPDGISVALYDHNFRLHGYWARVSTPADPNYEFGDNLELHFGGAMKFTMIEAGVQYTANNYYPYLEFSQPSGSSPHFSFHFQNRGGSGTIAGAPRWMQGAAEALKALPAPKWPANPWGQAD